MKLIYANLIQVNKSGQLYILTSSKIEPTLAVTNNTGVLCPAIILNDKSNSGSTCHKAWGSSFSKLLHFSIQSHTHTKQSSPTNQLHYFFGYASLNKISAATVLGLLATPTSTDVNG
jgi:hypothetical protein